MVKRFVSSFVLTAFLITNIFSGTGYAQINLPAPGTMITLTQPYTPVLMKGLQVHTENPLLFDFIVDAGKSGMAISSPEFKTESQKLVKYFLAAMTIKEDDLWVNLSPNEPDRIIENELGKTEMGQDMLAQDYILKQLTASLMYPEKELGQTFWNKIYAEAKAKFGTTDIPVDTFNKVWIVADKAKVYEKDNAGYVVGAHLKVLLEADYSAEKQVKTSKAQGQDDAKLKMQLIMRQVIIPAIEKEVNEGKNFAQLRQMFYSMILATWYKRAIKNALLNQVYSNKAKVGGVLSDDPKAKEKIYQQYLESFKKGAYDYIKEEYDPTQQKITARKYFSGGVTPRVDRALLTTREATSAEKAGFGEDEAKIRVQIAKLDGAMLAEETLNRYQAYFAKQGLTIYHADLFNLNVTELLEAVKRGEVIYIDFSAMKQIPVSDDLKEEAITAVAAQISTFERIVSPEAQSVVGYHVEPYPYTVVEELVKNAFIHGNQLDPDFPVFLFIDKETKTMGVYNGINVVDAATAKQNKYIVTANSFGGAEMGIAGIRKWSRLAYQLEDVVDADSVIGKKAVVKADPAMTSAKMEHVLKGIDWTSVQEVTDHNYFRTFEFKSFGENYILQISDSPGTLTINCFQRNELVFSLQTFFSMDFKNFDLSRIFDTLIIYARDEETRAANRLEATNANPVAANGSATNVISVLSEISNTINTVTIWDTATNYTQIKDFPRIILFSTKDRRKCVLRVSEPDRNNQSEVYIARDGIKIFECKMRFRYYVANHFYYWAKSIITEVIEFVRQAKTQDEESGQVKSDSVKKQPEQDPAMTQLKDKYSKIDLKGLNFEDALVQATQALDYYVDQYTYNFSTDLDKELEVLSKKFFAYVAAQQNSDELTNFVRLFIDHMFDKIDSLKNIIAAHNVSEIADVFRRYFLSDVYNMSVRNHRKYLSPQLGITLDFSDQVQAEIFVRDLIKSKQDAAMRSAGKIDRETVRQVSKLMAQIPATTTNAKFTAVWGINTPSMVQAEKAVVVLTQIFNLIKNVSPATIAYIRETNVRRINSIDRGWASIGEVYVYARKGQEQSVELYQSPARPVALNIMLKLKEADAAMEVTDQEAQRQQWMDWAKKQIANLTSNPDALTGKDEWLVGWLDEEAFSWDVFANDVEERIGPEVNWELFFNQFIKYVKKNKVEPADLGNLDTEILQKLSTDKAMETVALDLRVYRDIRNAINGVGNKARLKELEDELAKISLGTKTRKAVNKLIRKKDATFDQAMKVTARDVKDFAEMLNGLSSADKAEVSRIVAEGLKGGNPGQTPDPAMKAELINMIDALQEITPKQIEEFVKQDSLMDSDQKKLLIKAIKDISRLSKEDEEKLITALAGKYSQKYIIGVVNKLVDFVEQKNKQTIGKEVRKVLIAGGVACVLMSLIVVGVFLTKDSPDTNLMVMIEHSLFAGAVFFSTAVLTYFTGKKDDYKDIQRKKEQAKNTEQGDAAQLTAAARDSAIKQAPGGIALNGEKMELGVAKQGTGVDMKLDPAMVAEFEKGNFTGVQGIILSIIPIANPLLN
ncbi:MAG: hypothetical protein HQL25_08480 [Candidatus Omnitrophica bacterium]|nr:hypothetical protein [Candidatus Omnitrophota bacterium]